MPAAKTPRSIIAIWAVVLIVLSMTLPVILVKRTEVNISPAPIYELPIAENAADPQLNIPVYMTEEQTIVDIPLELYVRGVVAAEMPAEFELEALKAQAIAARTYIVRKIVRQDFAKSPVPGAWVSDTTADQAHLTEDQLQERWSGRAYTENISKINRAVAETRGLIITYEGEPIDATYFSTSNGYTENSEEYWSEPIPYLRSVESPWDEAISPKYQAVTEIAIHEMMDRLGLQAVPVSTGSQLGMEIAERTSGNRIKRMTINGTEFSGREVREKLGLPSSEFTWKINGDSVEFTTYGYGHGVGMSQYGANGLAAEGKRADDILSYYYQDIDIVHMDQISGWQQFAAEPAADIGPSA